MSEFRAIWFRIYFWLLPQRESDAGSLNLEARMRRDCITTMRWARGHQSAMRAGPLIIMLAITKSHVMGHERVLIRIIYPSHFYVILEERRSRSIHHHYLHGHGNIARTAHASCARAFNILNQQI
jgi:hypothetical protein